MWTAVPSTGFSGGTPMARRRSARSAVLALQGAGPVCRPAIAAGPVAAGRWRPAAEMASPPIPATSTTATTAAMASRRRRSRRRRSAACRALAACRRR